MLKMYTKGESESFQDHQLIINEIIILFKVCILCIIKLMGMNMYKLGELVMNSNAEIKLKF